MPPPSSAPEAPAPPSGRPGLAQAERQFVRSVVAGLVLLGAVAVAGPLLSYRSDVAVARAEFQSRMTREARVYAEALGLHLKLLQTELLRVSEGVGPDVKRELPTEDLQDLTTPRAGLFHAGVMVLDAQGKLRWSDPPLEDSGFATRPWFQQVLARQTSVVDAIAPGASLFVVAVPVVRGGQTTAVLAGLLDTEMALPGGRPLSNDLELLVLNASGDLFLPSEPPSWANVSRASGELRDFIREGVRPPSLNATPETFLTATPVPGTGLHLVLAADETALLAGLRDRFLVQLLVLALLQVGTLVLFTVHWRRVYGLFREVETRSAQQEKMAALGSAASLIAHEVKNSLNGLKAATGLVSPEGEGGLVVRTLHGQIDRLAHLATSLLNFGKPPVVRRVDVDVPPARAPLSCDPLLLTTALDNLVRNAMEATVAAKDLGRVTEPRVQVRARLDADAAVVTVEDNGGGPTPDMEGHLFEPFHTSKPKGIGLGLAMTRQALEHQGGQLTFERLPDGSRFLLLLPRVPRP